MGPYLFSFERGHELKRNEFNMKADPPASPARQAFDWPPQQM
jgi:hypothetical protein